MGRLGVVAGAVALATTFGSVTAGADDHPEPAGQPPAPAASLAGIAVDGDEYRLTLAGRDGRFEARLEMAGSHGWSAVGGKRIAFALVGEGSLTGPASCVTPESRICSVSVRSDGQDAATLAAGFGGVSVISTVGIGS